MTSDGIAAVLLVAALCLTIMGYGFQRPALGFAGSGFWILLALYSISLSAATWDIYFGMFWVSIAMAIVAGLESFVLRPKLKDDELYNVLDHDSWEDYAEEMEKKRNRLATVRRPTRRVQNERKDEEATKRKVRKMLN